VTQEALSLGYELQAVLPFERNEYVKDFDKAASATYQKLLRGEGSSPVIFELDGTRQDGGASRSYLAAGRLVLQQTDVLIAVWDGENEKGAGGSGQIVREALQNGVPVVWIKWGPPSDKPWTLMTEPKWKLLERPEDRDGDAIRLKETVVEILLPPDRCPKRCHLEPDCLRASYYEERQPDRSFLGGFWDFALGIVAPRRDPKTGKLKMPSWKSRVEDFGEATTRSWNEEEEKIPVLAKSQSWKDAGKHYFLHYGWANQLSMFYARLHRSSFALNCLLGALAVGLALAGGWVLMKGGREYFWIAAELVTIAAIIITTKRGQRGHWHRRWIEYRTLAERFRLSRPMALIGGWRQQTSMPGHLARYGDPVNSWVHWHYRAVERAAGVPRGRLDVSRLEQIKQAFLKVLAQGQIGYHQRTKERYDAADRRLHRLSNGFFIATFMVCAAHLTVESFFPNGLVEWLKILTIGLNAFLPACAAAFTAVRNQGEFRRLSLRSAAMEQALTGLDRELSVIFPADRALKSVEMRQVIERIARLMLNETLDWRIVFQDRPPDFPA
jgi:hypothetical protein